MAAALVISRSSLTTGRSRGAVEPIGSMTERAGLKILDVELNKINGGSFWVTVARKPSAMPQDEALVSSLLKEESCRGVARSQDL